MKVHIIFLTALTLCFLTQNTESVCDHEKQGTDLCEVPIVDFPSNPCEPSPCGPKSICREINNMAVCSCLPDYIGSPPTCRPECLIDEECPPNRACIQEKCRDPCLDICGKNALCEVINHTSICSCSSGYTGDPFLQCDLVEDSKPQDEKSAKLTT